MRRPAVLTYRLILAMMAVLGVWGLLLTVFPFQPFWIDEWRFIYNLKFLPWNRLWGPMWYTQQCPRLYLAALKALAGPLHYSYVALRLPALLLSLASMLLAWRLMRRLFPEREDWLRPLFVLIIISSQTFTTYLVQAKHYEAEIFLALVALWQCLELQRICSGERVKPARYILLCCTLAVAPFLSYTYPVAIAPALLLTGLNALKRRQIIFSAVIPIAAALAGIAAFYITDVRQLMQDEQMHRYWAYKMATGGVAQRLKNLWYFFATVGPGAVFEIVFGVLGISGALYATSQAFGKAETDARKRWMAGYAVLLVMLVLILSAIGRLPAGEAKFSAFCVPVLGWVLVNLLQWLQLRFSVWPAVVCIILFAELTGNIFSVIYNFHTAPEYVRRMNIYRATESAITQAQQLNVPIALTPGVAWPDEIVHKVPFLENMTADAIAKTWPAYDVKHGVSLYSISSVEKGDSLFLNHPQSVIVGDGMHYRLSKRK